jgi:hypothetical protein
MKVRWRNVDASRLDTLTVARELYAKLAMPAQYLRQQAVGTGVHNDEQRRTAIAWELFSDASERSEAAAGSADRDDRVRDHRDSCDRRSFQLDNVYVAVELRDCAQRYSSCRKVSPGFTNEKPA